jgi:uracil phosphoribosyltransferase
MCGIVATIGYTKEDVNEMLEIISHRGRDNRGIVEFQYNDKNIILIDPMLATGQSMYLAYQALCKHGKPKMYSLQV